MGPKEAEVQLRTLKYSESDVVYHIALRIPISGSTDPLDSLFAGLLASAPGTGFSSLSGPCASPLVPIFWPRPCPRRLPPPEPYRRSVESLTGASCGEAA